ncbi:ribosome small subunit-dependent GTPase A [Micromonospora carbonacea]|uniref:Small ribosomal subunit biogenesis GTPase RsgA n=1 Tax=Micromonospora carbonacea TaxID=47853 RepID=A0A1C4X9N1_9ACTN|nr:ribosome small subunit-dependent GTPase A [Micromonospora carbonacea]MBB5825373.1 ribosome biogenesis GTPase [Micromonospora carbonacea]QLD26568.1 ribosome small subunit-dependent GTPase A [Micromonospora carbonacea]SCF05146.1 ribosome biogenesis GTPase [Micromonospora carbonacea]
MSIDLTALGWDADRAAHARTRPGRRPGRVARVDRGVCTVLDADGPVRATLGAAVLADAARDLTRLPCAGDWVLLRSWPDGPVTVESVLPRRTALVRRTAGKDASGQVLAANLDAAAVVEPVHPEPDVGRIERLLSLVHESGATPLVVLAKADLAADPAAIARQLAGVAPGVPVLPVSAERGDGLDALRPHVAPGRTLALLGPSGAGKSSLVNALAGAVVMPTQAIRRVDGKGRHTTTWRALVPVPGGGAVLDTPGVRAVGLLDGAAGLDRAFADIAALAAGCRYGDCAHDAEPGCAVRDALAAGELAVRRYDSWRRLQREVAFESRRRETRLAAERRGGWRGGRRRTARP